MKAPRCRVEVQNNGFIIIDKYLINGIKIVELNMSPDPLERYVNPDSQYRYDENTFRFHDQGNGLWHSEGGTLKQNYNNIRNLEIQIRNQEIFHNVTHFYFSGNGIIILFISLGFCLLTSTFSIEGLFFWNMVLLIIVWGFYEVTVRKKVRAEWDEIQEEIETI